MRARKLAVMSIVAIAIPVAGIAGFGGVNAWAKGAPVTATGTVTCTTISGSAKFKPALISSGATSGTETITTKLTMSGCTTSGSNVSGTGKGAVKGTITTDMGNSCTGLFGVIDTTASLPVKWSGFSSKIATSTINITQVDGEAAGANGNPAFAWGSQAQATTNPSTVTGSFATSSGSGEVDASISASTLATNCASKKGIKALDFSAGSITS
jgi:hypothetical protein